MKKIMPTGLLLLGLMAVLCAVIMPACSRAYRAEEAIERAAPRAAPPAIQRDHKELRQPVPATNLTHIYRSGGYGGDWVHSWNGPLAGPSRGEGGVRRWNFPS